MNQCRIRKDDSDMDPGKGIAYTVPHGSGNICATSRHTDKEKEGVGGDPWLHKLSTVYLLHLVFSVSYYSLWSGDALFGENKTAVLESFAGSIGDASLHFSQQDEGMLTRLNTYFSDEPRRSILGPDEDCWAGPSSRI